MRRYRNSSNNWQAYIRNVPTRDGSSYTFKSHYVVPLSTAEAAARLYDAARIAVLGADFVEQGTNVNFNPESYAEEVSLQCLYI